MICLVENIVPSSNVSRLMDALEDIGDPYVQRFYKPELSTRLSDGKNGIWFRKPIDSDFWTLDMLVYSYSFIISVDEDRIVKSNYIRVYTHDIAVDEPFGEPVTFIEDAPNCKENRGAKLAAKFIRDEIKRISKMKTIYEVTSYVTKISRKMRRKDWK